MSRRAARRSALFALYKWDLTGNVDLDYLLVADNPPNEFWHYPDSNKYGFRAPRKIFRATEVDYHDGEE